MTEDQEELGYEDEIVLSDVHDQLVEIQSSLTETIGSVARDIGFVLAIIAVLIAAHVIHHW